MRADATRTDAHEGLAAELDAGTENIDREAYELALAAGVGQPTTDVVVVTYNSRPDLERCFSSIERAAARANARILVVDNGSVDGSLEFCLGRPHALVEAVALLQNRGYAAAVNAAAACSTADYLVILNPDIEVLADDAILRLVTHLEDHPAAGVAAPRLLNPDGSVQSSARIVPNVPMLAARQSRIGQMRWGRAWVKKYLCVPEPQGAYATIEWAIGAAMAVRRSEFDRLGGWDEGFFLYFEDVDFCTRLSKAGRQVHYLADVEMIHAHRRSSDRRNGSAVHSATRRWHLRSAARFFCKHPRYAVRGALGPYRLARTADAMRRLIDVLAAATILVALAPVIAFIAIAIRRDSPGPVLFRQQRLGKGAKPFTLLKFRTMHVGADAALTCDRVMAHVNGKPQGERDGRPVYKLWPDPRITRVGAALRRWSLDELPQLINVLRGDMTLVGFRPPTAEEVQHYPSWYFHRFDLKPGLTGLWQVSGRNERSYEEMILLDVEYSLRRSLRLDLELLARTPLTVLSGRGAV